MLAWKKLRGFRARAAWSLKSTKKYCLICCELTEKTIAQAAQLGCMRIAPQWNLAGPMPVAKAHAAGLSVNLWCSDSTFIYDTVKAWGADVSTSNVPRAIIAHARGASR